MSKEQNKPERAKFEMNGLQEPQKFPMDTIGNLSGDEYSLSCIRCGALNDLHQVAFRNVNQRVIGYMFACRSCEKHIFGKSLLEIFRRLK